MTPEEKILILLSNKSLSESGQQYFKSLLEANPDWDKIISASRFHSLAPLLIKHLTESNLQNALPSAQLEKIKSIARNQTIKRLKIISVYREFTTALISKNIDFILLKGLYLSDNFYSNPELRPMQDIDLLVREKDLHALLLLMKELNAKSLVELQTDFINGFMQHLPPFVYKEVMIEIHTNIVSANEPVSFKPESLWTAIELKKIQNIDSLVFSAELNFVYLCIHLGRHVRTAKYRLIWFTDIMQFLATVKLDINKVKAIISNAGAAELVSDVLCLLEKYWEFPIPDELKSNSLTLSSRVIMNFEDGLLRRNSPDEFYNFQSWKQIPGFLNKLRYLFGIAFPSISYMKKKYSFSSSLLLIPLYPYNASKVIFKGIKLLIS